MAPGVENAVSPGNRSQKFLSMCNVIDRKWFYTAWNAGRTINVFRKCSCRAMNNNLAEIINRTRVINAVCTMVMTETRLTK